MTYLAGRRVFVAILFTVTCAIALLTSCARKVASPRSCDNQTINIDPKDQYGVDHKTVFVCPGQYVTWTTTEDAAVDFVDGSPFQNGKMHVDVTPNGPGECTNGDHGCIAESVNAPEGFKYTVFAKKSNKKFDPHIILMPPSGQ